MKPAKKSGTNKGEQAQTRSEASVLILPDYFFAPAKQAAMRFSYQIRNFFLPVAENGYRPHFHHPRHLSTFGATLIAFKIMMVGLVFSSPTQAFVLADVLEDQKASVVAQTNILRSNQGIGVLAVNSTLTASAQAKAEDMAEKQYFGHAGPEGNRLAYWLGKTGYKYSLAGENLAMGFNSASAAMTGWVNSPTHYANLVESRYTEFGVGVASGTYEGKPTVFLVQHFGAPKAISNVQSPISNGQTEIEAEPVAPLHQGSEGSSTNSNDIFGQPLVGRAEASQNITASGQSVREPVKYDMTMSRVAWSEVGDQVTISASAKISGLVSAVTVMVGSMPIELAYDKAADRYIGQVTIANTNSNVSSALTVPTIQIKSASGQVMTDSIDWATVQTLSENPTDHYLAQATNKNNGWLPLELLHWMIVGGLVGLGASLLLQIWVAWKEKKPVIGADLVGMFIVIVSFLAI